MLTTIIFITFISINYQRIYLKIKRKYLMNFKYYRFFLTLFLLLFFSVLFSQNNSDDYLESIAFDIIKESQNCVFVTLNSENKPTTRIMEHNIYNKNFEIYLVTNPFSRKVSHLKSNPIVSLNFQSNDRLSYVSVNGEAQLIDDIKLKNKYWKEEWTPHYKNIETDCVLIKIIPESLEIVSLTNEVLGDSKTWKPKTISIDN
jgi:general stress protein 26